MVVTWTFGDVCYLDLDARKQGLALFNFFSHLSLDFGWLGDMFPMADMLWPVVVSFSMFHWRSIIFALFVCLVLVEFTEVAKSKSFATPFSSNQKLFQNDFSLTDIFTWMSPRCLNIKTLKNENILPLSLYHSSFPSSVFPASGGSTIMSSCLDSGTLEIF